MRITFISSFVPRKCGIATYTRDLSLDIKRQGDFFDVVAMENPFVLVKYSSLVKATIRQDDKQDYKNAADAINNSSTDIVHLQHEFGLFGGLDGEYILELAKALSKPLITTFHTILLAPSDHQKYIIQELTRLSRAVVVMEEIAKYRLEQIYGLNVSDISVIPHGVPKIIAKKKAAKKDIGYPNSFILLATNLLSRNKGIEYAIEAVAKALPSIPSLVFLVVGETHPVVKVHEGESYREELSSLIAKLHLENHVILENEYVSLEKLQMLLASADVYITPYLDPQQITSGTLAYAIGADKACIATEYVYAKEMLSKGRGALVPLRDGGAIAKALVDLYRHPKKRLEMEKKARSVRKNMSWYTVSKKHRDLYRQKISEGNTIPDQAKIFLEKPLDVSYLSHLTDSVGIMQHAYHTVPDRKFGYSTDDNARAFIIACGLYKQRKKKEDIGLMKTYLSFLQYVSEPNGKAHTFLNFSKGFDDEAGVSDAYGKIMWSFGFYLSLHKDLYFTQAVHTLFVNGLAQIEAVRDVRTAAYVILGLYYYLETFESKTDQSSLVISAVQKLADFLVECYKNSRDGKWNWFEERITYDNFRIPQAMLAAYMVTKKLKYKKVAAATLKFITECNFDEKKGYFDFIGQNGWYKKGDKREEYDQQPLEAGGAVETFLFAAQILNDKKYIDKALLSFEWFFGKNRNHRLIYDKQTKGVHDGLNLRGVSQNEGAESLVCFLMATLLLSQFLKKGKH